jgi:hypothetical protein
VSIRVWEDLIIYGKRKKQKSTWIYGCCSRNARIAGPVGGTGPPSTVSGIIDFDSINYWYELIKIWHVLVRAKHW